MAEYKVLQHNDLRKRGGERLKIFVAKIKDGTEFFTAKGSVIFDKKQFDGLYAAMDIPGYSGSFKGKVVGGGPVVVEYPKEFFKTPEFGGKGAGSGTAAEDFYLTEFKGKLNAVFEIEKTSSIRLRCCVRIINCAGIISTPQTGRRAPKSDFSIVDVDGNQTGWLSHKAGRKPSDFQQYGGLSDSTFNSSTEVKKFMKDCAKKFPNGLPPKSSVARLVKDNSIITKSIYGVNYGAARGIENVDEFHQGSMTLKKSGKVYEIKSNHKGKNGDIPKSGGYECIYFARYTSDRGARVAGLFVGNARIGVFPAGKIVGTTQSI